MRIEGLFEERRRDKSHWHSADPAMERGRERERERERWMMDSLEMFIYNSFLEEKDFTKYLPLDMASLCDSF